MKKIMWIAVLMTAFIMGSVFAQERKPNPASDFVYDLTSSNELKILEYVGKAKYVVIPSEIEGFPVTDYAYDIFKNTRESKGVSFIEGVEFPDTINRQLSGFLEGGLSFPHLKKVKYGGSIKQLEVANVETVVLPKKAETVSIYECTKLTNLEFPEDAEIRTLSIRSYCGLKNLRIPKNISLRDLEVKDKSGKCLIESIEFLGSNCKKIHILGAQNLKTIIFPEEQPYTQKLGVLLYECPALTEIVNLDALLANSGGQTGKLTALPLAIRAKLKQYGTLDYYNY